MEDRTHDYTKPIGLPDDISKVQRNITKGCFLREIGRYKNTAPSEFLWAAEDKLVEKQMFEELRCQLPDSPRSTFLMVFSPDGKKVASTHGNHNVYVTDLTTGKNIQTLTGHPRTPWCIAFHPSSNQILASGCLGGQVRVWDLHGGSEVWTAESQTVIASLAFHPVDRMLVIATYNELHFWDWSQPEPFAKCSTRSEREKVRYVTFDRLGNKLITGIANPINIPSQWDRVTCTNPGAGAAGPPGLGSTPTQPTTLSNATTTTTTTSPSDQERSISFCYRHLMNQYNQLVRRYFNLSRSRITPTMMDRGTDPMEVADGETSSMQASPQAGPPGSDAAVERSADTSVGSVTSSPCSPALVTRSPSSRERFRIHSSLLSGPSMAVTTSTNTASTVSTVAANTVVTTSPTAASTASSASTPAAAAAAAPPTTQATILRGYGINLVSGRPVCLTFTRDSNRDTDGDSTTAASTSTTATTTNQVSSISSPRVSSLPSYRVSVDEPARSRNEEVATAAGGLRGTARTAGQLGQLGQLPRIPNLWTQTRSSEPLTPDEMQINANGRLGRRRISALPGGPRVRLLLSSSDRPSTSESEQTATPSTQPSQTVASTTTQVTPSTASQQQPFQLQLLNARETYRVNLHRHIFRPRGQIVLSRHSNSPFQPRMPRPLITTPASALADSSAPRPEIPSGSSSFVPSVSSSSTSSTPSTSTSSSLIRQARNRLLFFESIKILLRNRIRNASDNANANSTDSTVNYSSMANEESQSASNGELAAGSSDREAPGSSRWDGGREGRSRHRTSLRSGMMVRRARQAAATDEAAEMGVREGIQVLSLHIENMQQLCRARIEILQLQQIRKMWEDLTTQIRSLHNAIQESRGREDEAGGSRDPVIPSVSNMMRMARISDSSPVRQSTTDSAEETTQADVDPPPTNPPENQPSPPTDEQPGPGPSGESQDSNRVVRKIREAMRLWRNPELEVLYRRAPCQHSNGSGFGSPTYPRRYFRVGDACSRFRLRLSRRRLLSKKLEVMLHNWRTRCSAGSESGSGEAQPGPSGVSSGQSTQPSTSSQPEGGSTQTGPCHSCGNLIKKGKSKRKRATTTRIPPRHSTSKAARTNEGERSEVNAQPEAPAPTTEATAEGGEQPANSTETRPTSELFGRMIERMETMVRFQTDELTGRAHRYRRMNALVNLSDESESDHEESWRRAHLVRGANRIHTEMSHLRARRMLGYMVDSLTDFFQEASTPHFLDDQIINLYTLLHLALELTDLLLDQLNSTSRDLERTWAMDNVEVGQEDPSTSRVTRRLRELIRSQYSRSGSNSRRESRDELHNPRRVSWSDSVGRESRSNSSSRNREPRTDSNSHNQESRSNLTSRRESRDERHNPRRVSWSDTVGRESRSNASSRREPRDEWYNPRRESRSILNSRREQPRDGRPNSRRVSWSDSNSRRQDSRSDSNSRSQDSRSDSNSRRQDSRSDINSHSQEPRSDSIRHSRDLESDLNSPNQDSRSDTNSQGQDDSRGDSNSCNQDSRSDSNSHGQESRSDSNSRSRESTGAFTSQGRRDAPYGSSHRSTNTDSGLFVGDMPWASSSSNRRRLFVNPFLRSFSARPGTSRASPTANRVGGNLYRPLTSTPPTLRARCRRSSSRVVTGGVPIMWADGSHRPSTTTDPAPNATLPASSSHTSPNNSRVIYELPVFLRFNERTGEREDAFPSPPSVPRDDRQTLWIRYHRTGQGETPAAPTDAQHRESTFTVPMVQVNDVPVPDVSMLNQPRHRPLSPVPRASEDIWRWRAWRPRFLHPRYFGPNPFEESDPSDLADPGSSYYRGNPAMYTVDPVIITDAPMSPHHRIQAWDFSKLNIPDISDRGVNSVVTECKIHNDASVDVSNDGHLLVTLLPTGRLSVTTMLGVYSLDWNSLGQLLYKTSFEQNAVSVSLSPTNRHLVVGLASRPLVLRSGDRDRTNIAQIFRLEGARATPSGATWHSGRGRLVHMRDLEPRESSVMSLNCIRWAPGAGQGLVYGTNTGQLKVLR